MTRSYKQRLNSVYIKGSRVLLCFFRSPIVLTTGAIAPIEINQLEVISMSMKPSKELLKTLLALKVTLRDTAEPSINHALDEAIAKLQRIIKDNDDSKTSRTKVLGLVGDFLKSLPSIVKLIELFND